MRSLTLAEVGRIRVCVALPIAEPEGGRIFSAPGAVRPSYLRESDTETDEDREENER